MPAEAATPASSLDEPAGRPYLAPGVDLLGVCVHRLGLAEALQAADGFVRSGRPHRIVTANLDFLRLARADQSFRSCLNSADLVLADGMPLVWASRLARRPIPGRITGIDFTQALASLSAKSRYSLFLLGAAPGVAARAADVLQRRHDGLRIAGVYSPPFGPHTAADDEAMVEAVLRAGPDILLVALGAPAQDLWIATHLQRLAVPLSMGVGSTFDVLAGALGRAPSLLQSAGLEWLYRLSRQPRHLWKRYLVYDAPVLLRLALAAARTPSTAPYSTSQELHG